MVKSEYILASPESLKIPVMRLAGAVRNIDWQIRSPRTFGAGVALTDIECQTVALVRPTYGRRLWQLPGGGISKADKKIAKEKVKLGVYPTYLNGSLFEPSARRELKEEVGIDSEDRQLDHILTYSTNEHGNRDTFAIFHLPLDIEVVEFKPQMSEIEQVRWFSLDCLPDNGVSYLGELADTLQHRRQV